MADLDTQLMHLAEAAELLGDLLHEAGDLGDEPICGTASPKLRAA